jgi:hypothetical protein
MIGLRAYSRMHLIQKEVLAQEMGGDALARERVLVVPILVWAVWGAMTVATLLFIWHYSRNIPCADDFSLVPVMTGHEPVSLRWLWSQHNEHRPIVPRLVMVGLNRLISIDFRLGLYVNGALLSAAAASMLLLTRKLRGHTRLVDVVLPLSILNIGQAQTLLLGLTMALTMTSLVSCELIRLASAQNSRLGLPLTLKLGLFLVLLPLCGAGGLIMLPPLLLWLACESIWGCRREGNPERVKVARAIGVALLVVCLAVVAFYMLGYKSPPNHRPPTSFAAAMSTLLEYLSLVIWPNVLDYWRAAGLIVAFLVAATLVRLCLVGLRQPDDRVRAFAMVAVILAMLCAAVAVGYSRSFIGLGGARVGRYVTTTSPLFCALYVAWLIHGSARTRRLIHAALFVVVILTVPTNIKHGLSVGESRRVVYTRLERDMNAHSTLSAVVKNAWPDLYPSKEFIEVSFKMLKEAQVGRFGDLVDDRLANAPNGSSAIQ